jgi:hypothetical protein
VCVEKKKNRIGTRQDCHIFCSNHTTRYIPEHYRGWIPLHSFMCSPLLCHLPEQRLLSFTMRISHNRSNKWRVSSLSSFHVKKQQMQMQRASLSSLDSVYFDIGCCYINLSNLSVSCWSWISGNAPQFCRSKWRRLFLIICLFALQRPASQQDHAERSDMVTTYALYGH